MNSRARKLLGAALLCGLGAVIATSVATNAHAWVTCPDGQMADYGACPGPPGSPGRNGRSGRQGRTGETGAQGVPGETGAQGVPGETGAQGVPGETGAQGVLGETGAQGVQGKTGAQGVQGKTGAQGVQGKTGRVKLDWAAMAIAAGSIPYTDDPVSIGAGFGVAGGTGAISLGARVKLSEAVRFQAELLRTREESGFVFSIATGW